jgi:predicted ATP-grasp superfamily ATP-dependent carboligase
MLNQPDCNAGVTRDKARERVLVMGDDMRIFLAVVRSLGRGGKEVHVAPLNWHSPALHSRYIAQVHHFPRYSDDPNGWRCAVLNALQTYGFELVVPCCDPAILPLHTHRQDFSGYRIAIPDPLAMELLFDKERTRELCVELGIPVAATARISATDSAETLAHRFGLPLVLKPRKSFWLDRLDCADKVWIVESKVELGRVLAGLEERSRYLAQSYFEGVGVGVSVLAEKGEVLHAFQHRRLREGLGGSSSYRVSEPVNANLYSACLRICGKARHTGVCMFEFRWNPDTHKWIVLETNARFWGSVPLPVSLGVDFPLFLYDLLVHGNVHPPVSYPAGIRARNLVLDGANLFSSVRRLSSGELARRLNDIADFVSQPWRWMTGRERSDTFVRDDLKPALWECLTLYRTLAEKRRRSRSLHPNRRRPEQTASLSHSR